MKSYYFKRFGGGLGGYKALQYATGPAINSNTMNAVNFASRLYRKSFKKGRRYGPGFSGGRFRKGRRVKRKLYKKQVAGVHLTLEKGAVKTSDETGAGAGKRVNTIGHITHPMDQVWYMLAFSLAKKLSILMRRPFENIYEQISDVSTGHQFYFTYQQAGISNTPINLIFLTVPGGGTTWANFINLLRNGMIGISSPYMLQKIVSLDGNNNSDYMVITDAVFYLYVKSSLKLQNQSVNTSEDNEADDVNNVPLFGKSFEGPGSGTYIIPNDDSLGTVNSGYFGDEGNGIITRNTTGAENGIDEPPIGFEFSKKPKVGKAKIEPGQIKTSVLTHRMTIPVNKFILKNLPYPATTRSNPDYHIGKYRFFTLEKMIETAVVASRSDILVAYEHNLYMYANVKIKAVNKTSRVYLDQTV